MDSDIEEEIKEKTPKRKLKTWVKIVLLVIGALAVWFVFDMTGTTDIIMEPRRAPKIHLGVCVDSLDVKNFKVKRNQTLSDILMPYGITSQQIHEVAYKDRKQFDVRDMKAGNEYTIMTNKNSPNELEYFVYCRDLSEYVVCGFVDTITVGTLKKKIKTVRQKLSVRIDNSLFYDISEAGGANILSSILSDVYQWSIDFYGIQKGDSVTVIYDEKFVDSTSLGIDNIIAAKFIHINKPYYAIGYVDGKAKGFWNESGESLRKAFLMAPLKFKRISSKYSNARMHPVLRIVRPHRGVDYAAPIGTPVWSVADGIVTRRSYDKANGNILKIRHNLHNGRYETGYLHLNSFARGIRVGTRVKQGQTIAYVGNTGLSSGPHLDYRIWRNGKNINPLTISQEKGTPISKKIRKEYDLYKKDVIDILNGKGV